MTVITHRADHIEARFDDDTRVRLAVTSATPDKDRSVEYAYTIHTDRKQVIHSSTLFSGQDSRVDLRRALGDLADILVDLHVDNCLPAPMHAWVEDHLDELLDLIHRDRPAGAR